MEMLQVKSFLCLKSLCALMMKPTFLQNPKYFFTQMYNNQFRVAASWLPEWKRGISCSQGMPLMPCQLRITSPPSHSYGPPGELACLWGRMHNAQLCNAQYSFCSSKHQLSQSISEIPYIHPSSELLYCWEPAASFQGEPATHQWAKWKVWCPHNIITCSRDPVAMDLQEEFSK